MSVVVDAYFIINLTMKWDKVFKNGPSQICGALRDLVPFAQFKKREKHLWMSVNFSKVAG